MALLNRNLNEIIERQEEHVDRMMRETYKLGFMQGFRDGYACGVEDTTDHYKPALSDGLRKGSPVCGRAMNNLKKR